MPRHPVDFKKVQRCHVDFKKVLCRMSLRPQKGCVDMSILGVYAHHIHTVYDVTSTGVGEVSTTITRLSLLVTDVDTSIVIMNDIALYI